MIFRAFAVQPVANTRDKFHITIDNYSMFPDIPYGVFTKFILYYTVEDDERFIPNGASSYFKRKNAPGSVEIANFETHTEFYDEVAMRAPIGAFEEHITIEKLNPATCYIENCEDIDFTSRIIDGILTDIERRLNETVFGVCEETIPMFK